MSERTCQRCDSELTSQYVGCHWCGRIVCTDCANNLPRFTTHVCRDCLDVELEWRKKSNPIRLRLQKQAKAKIAAGAKP